MKVMVEVPGLAGGTKNETETRWGRYDDGRRPALQLICDDGELWATVSVNPPAWRQWVDSERHIAVKNWSEGEGMPAALIAAGVIKPLVVATVLSGFVSIPIYELTEAALEEIRKADEEAEERDEDLDEEENE